MVMAKETKYSIAKQYGITIEELEKKNPGSS
jgi:LysM repeat protein